MKKIEGNKSAKALKELQAIDERLVENVDGTINETERKMYHVGLVRVIDRPGEAKNKVNVNVQVFHEQSFEKLKKNFKFLGFSKLVVIHDPKLDNGELPKKEVAPKQMTPEEMEAEIERRANEKAKTIVESNESNEGSPVYGTTIAEMKSFAEANEIDLSGLKKIKDIENALKTWIQEKEA